MPTSSRYHLEPRRYFAKKLLDWRLKNTRDFPWRKTKNPYRILIAETLLRKTTAKQVQQIYSSFLEEYPSPQHLASADGCMLKKILRPLGLENRRAALLKKLAQDLIKKYGGAVPKHKEELMKLPGIGRYSANAVLCLAYGEELPMVDTNVIRVVTRFFGFKSKRVRLKDDPSLWTFVESILPSSKAKDFNLGLLDFAARVCTARNPKCNECPMGDLCKAKAKLQS